MPSCRRGEWGCRICQRLIRQLEQLLNVGIVTGRWHQFDAVRAELERHYVDAAKEHDTTSTER